MMSSHIPRQNTCGVGSDAALKSRGNFDFFMMVGVEGLAVLEHAVDDVQKLGHDGSYDDDWGLALCL